MLELLHINKRYQYQKVLDDISITLPQCGFIAIVGPSGCGKSTLLHILGGIDKDFQGELLFQQKNVKKHLSRYRQKHVSYIFQQFHLIMWLSVWQNITLSHYFHSHSQSQNKLDISEFDQLKMSSLSLGQRQRIAYLRARFQQSDILLCDEPTGSLDKENATKVMELLQEESQHRLVVLVSHDMALVNKYSDEIYTMSDGKMIDHKVKNIITQKNIQDSKKKRCFFPHLRLSLMSFLSHKGRSFQLVFGLMLSIVCIVLTLTMERSLENQIRQYIYSLIPESSLSFQKQNHSAMTLKDIETFQTDSALLRTQLYLDDYEFLGIGFATKRYQESEVVFIGDDTTPYDDLILKYGRKPSSQTEIVVSLSTAKHLCQDNDMSSLIGQKVYAWYQYQNEVKSINYNIVGITNQSTTMDTLYQYPNAYIDLLKDVYHFDKNKVKASMGIIYVDKNLQRSEVLKQLQNNYPQYQFVEVGTSTLNHMTETMNQVEIVLIVFSLLAILSSLFLIGEVMFLNVVQKKKDLAIMKCFGATSFDLIKIVFYESLEIGFCAQVLSTFLYSGFLHLASTFVREVLLNETMTFVFDYQLLAMVYGFSFVLIFISQLLPLIYVIKMNTIQALKE